MAEVRIEHLVKRFADVVYKEFYLDQNPPGGGGSPKKPEPGEE